MIVWKREILKHFSGLIKSLSNENFITGIYVPVDNNIWYSHYMYSSSASVNSWHVWFASEGDPSNYMTYFRRATVFLALGKSKSALPDLDKVVEIKPDFTAVSLLLI